MILTADGQTFEKGAGPAPAPAPLDGYACVRCRKILPLDDSASCSCGAVLETRRVRPGRQFGAAPDPSWQQTLDDFFGFNPFGGPRFRIVWAPERMELAFGEWTDYDEDDPERVARRVVGVRLIPKYPKFGERWIIEMWQPAERYGSPEAWYASEPVLGDYPFRGDYEHVFTFEYPHDRSFAMPSRRRIEVWSATTQETLSKTIRERLAASSARRERTEKAIDDQASDRYDELVKQPFYGVPQVSMAGPKSKGRRVVH